MTGPNSRWMTPADVCAYTKFSLTKLKLHRASADFPLPIKIGKRLFFVRTEIEAWTEAQEAAPRRQRIGAKSADGRAVV